MGQNLVQRKTQTVTHMPIGHYGADSMGRLFTGSHPVSSVRNTMLCWRCGYLSGSGPAAGVSKKADGKDVEKADRVYGGALVRVF